MAQTRSIKKTNTLFKHFESFIHATPNLYAEKYLLKNTANTTPPPPPPPASPTPQKNSRKLLLVAIIVAIIVIAAVGGAIALMGNNASSPNSNDNNPTGSSPSPNQQQTNAIAGASSIKFSVSYNSAASDADWGYTWSAKNLGTSNMMMRMEGTFSGASSSDNSNMIYIVNGAQQKAWMCSGDQWVDLSEGYADLWNTWNSTWEGYYEDFANWSGTGDYTYTSPVSGDSVRIYDVQINPQLNDSLFIHVD